MLAANISQTLNLSSYAKTLGVSVPTIKNWLSVLEASYIIYLLPPFYENFGKRITKSPKIYFYDIGLVSYLTGIETLRQYANGPLAGPIFENYIVLECLKREIHTDSHSKLYYFRSSSGEEIDLIIDRKSSKELIEIKHTSTFKPRMLNAIEKLMLDNCTGYLLYNGKNQPYKKNLHVLNFMDYLLS